MRRFLFITLAALAILVVLVVGAGAWLLNDESFLKNQAGKYARQYTGRELTVSGPLDLEIGRQTTLDARGIRFANAAWAETPDLLLVGHLRVTIDIPSLLSDLPYLPFFQLEDCSINLQENEAGEANWDVLPGQEAPQTVDVNDAGLLPVILHELQIDRCRLTVDSPDREKPLNVSVQKARLERDQQDRTVANVSGSFNGEQLDIDGWLGPNRAFNEGGELSHELKIRAGAVTLESSGSFADINTLASPAINAHFSGPDIGRLLDELGLPPAAEGPFDFRTRLNTQGGMSNIDVDGNFGNLDLVANGQLDRLQKPSAGNLQTSAIGPNLKAFAEAFGVEGLVAEAFDLSADLAFDAGVVRIKSARLATEQDELRVDGTLATENGLPNSGLTISLESKDISRWSHLFDRTWENAGAISLNGQADTDSNGVLSIDVNAVHGASTLHVEGEIGPLAGPYDPDLDFNFASSEMPMLAGLFDQPGFPNGQFAVTGHVQKKGQDVLIENLEAKLDQHRILLDGHLMLAKNFAGSELDVDLDIPDLATLGRLFGRQNLPSEQVLIKGSVKPVGEGIAFQIKNSVVGDIMVNLEGEIADLENPMGIDANFNLQFPDAEILHVLVPQLYFPEGALTVSGALAWQEDRTEVQQVILALGENRLGFDGSVALDKSFDFNVQFEGPDAGELRSLIGTLPENVPYRITTQLHGSPREFKLDGIAATVGDSELEGNLAIAVGDITGVSGDITSPYMNVSTWTRKDEDEPPAPPEKKKYVFDDTPVMQITELGVEIDLDIKIDTLDLGDSHIDDLDAKFVLQDKLIEFSPFTFHDTRGALLSGAFKLSSQGATPKLDFNLLAEDFHPLIGAKEGQDPATLPSGNFELTMQSTGQTGREIASNLDGKIRVTLGPGKLAPSAHSFLVTDFLEQLIRSLNPFSEKQEYTELECAVAAADIESGLVTLSPIVLHSKRLTIVSEGNIDLSTEKLNITFNSKQRKGLGISASNLVNPFIRVGGTMASPSLELDPASTVVKGGIAVATLGISILANSLADRFLSSKDPCGDALKQIAERDDTPP